MWPAQSHLWYDPQLLNFICPLFSLPFVPQSYQSTQIITNIPIIQQSPSQLEKSYRDTVEEIQQKIEKRTQNPRRKRMEKGRVMIKKEKEDNFERKKQKKDRNLPSNICKYFVSYLYHHPHLQKYLQPSENTQISQLLNSCILKMKDHINESQTYIRPGLLESMCRKNLLGEPQAELLRILFRKYMNCEYRLAISMMRKFTKKEKVAYFKMGRKLVKKFTANI